MAAADTVAVPPQNLEAEEHVLGACLLSPRAIDETRQVLAAPDFYRETHGTIYSAILRLADQQIDVDPVTLGAELERQGVLERIGGNSKIIELAGLTPAVTAAGRHAAIVKEKAIDRDHIRVAQLLQGFASNGGVAAHPEEVADLIRHLAEPKGAEPIELQTWRQFEQSATDNVPFLVDRLWPEEAFGFIAAPPKKGKTWLGLSLAIAVATGKPFLGQLDVHQAQPVVYLALEGHRAAIRARTGALARGMGVDPDSGDLANLHLAYKPRGINIADPAWAHAVARTVQTKGARLLVVDVLRAAAQIKENSNEEFAALRHNLQTIIETGCSIAILHHFGKLSEISRDRDPAERMAGAGAMFGALDVGLFITGYDEETRALRLHVDCRDIATPHLHAVQLHGHGTGENGGLSYRDTATWRESAAPDEDDLEAPSMDIREWLEQNGGEAREAEIAAVFGVTQKTISRRSPGLALLGVERHYKAGRAGGVTYKIAVETLPFADASHQQTLIRDPDTAPEIKVDRVVDTGWTGQGGQEAVSTLIPVSMRDSAQGRQGGHDAPVHPHETHDLQGFRKVDKVDTPTGCDLPADAGPPPEPTNENAVSNLEATE